MRIVAAAAATHFCKLTWSGSVARLYLWIVHPSGAHPPTHARNKQTNKQKSEKRLVLESRI